MNNEETTQQKIEGVYKLEIFQYDKRNAEYKRNGEKGFWYRSLDEPKCGYYSSVEGAEAAMLDEINLKKPEGWPLEYHSARISYLPLDQHPGYDAGCMYLYDKDGNRIADLTNDDLPFYGNQRFSDREIVEYIHYEPSLNEYIAEVCVIGKNILNEGDYLVIRYPEDSIQSDGEDLFDTSAPVNMDIEIAMLTRHGFYFETVKCLLKYKGLTPEEIKNLRCGKLSELKIQQTHERYGEHP